VCVCIYIDMFVHVLIELTLRRKITEFSYSLVGGRSVLEEHLLIALNFTRVSL
jgi:hypothetical protein